MTAKDVAVRLQVAPTSMTQAMVYISILPVAKTALAAKAQEWGMKESSGAWPHRLGYWLTEGEGDNPRFMKAKLGIPELETEGVGMGTLPLLELEIPAGQDPVQFAAGHEVAGEVVKRENLAREMTVLMRLTLDARNVWKRGSGCLEEVYRRTAKPEDKSSIRMSGRWPDMVEPRGFLNGESINKACKRKRQEGQDEKVQISVCKKRRFGGGGLMKESDFGALNLHPEAARLVAAMANDSLASTTWSAYASAMRSVKRCEGDWGVDLGLPWNESKVTNYIVWCARSGVKAATCRQYLSGIKKLHHKEGVGTLWDLDKKVVMVLRGYDNNTGGSVRVRVPMTLERMLSFKTGLAKKPWAVVDRRMLWLVACIMLKASLRASEILADVVDSYNQDKILLWRDLVKKETSYEGEMVESLVLKLKASKEQKNLKFVFVEVWASKDFVCPVEAYDKFVKEAGGRKADGDPVARWSDGSLITKARMNTELKLILGKKFNYEEGTVSTHSFRAGLATLMAEFGCSDQEIQSQGRWASSAFEVYKKSGMSMKWKEKMELSRRVEGMVVEKMKNFVA